MLPDDEVHIYYLDTPAVGELRDLLRILSPEECLAHDRFVFERDRRSYRLAHALTRTVLGRYTGADPRALAFERNAYGKPGLATLGFNLSHTTGMVACGVCAERDIGVDVEDTTRPNDWRKLAESVFSPRELRGVETQERFYELWTLKEAYIKARGMGLSLPLQEFTIAIRDEGRIELENDAGAWQFEQIAVGTFRLAMVVRVSGGRRWTVRWLDASKLLAGELGLTL